MNLCIYTYTFIDGSQVLEEPEVREEAQQQEERVRIRAGVNGDALKLAVLGFSSFCSLIIRVYCIWTLWCRLLLELFLVAFAIGYNSTGFCFKNLISE